MPYNTRRKSLSLPSLGIHLPLTQAERLAAQTTARPTLHVKLKSHRLAVENQAWINSDHKSKRIKRSHPRSCSTTQVPAVPSSTVSPYPCARVLSENTPPPSPGPPDLESTIIKRHKVDGIPSDQEFIDALFVQLSLTTNKPQPTRELSAALAQHFEYIHQSSNPCSIVASRLAAYMRQACWTDTTPCPIGKLIAGNPRRTYYYIVARYNPGIQVSSATCLYPAPCRPVSPPDSDEEIHLETRRALSPSPEIDLGSSSLDDGMDDGSQSNTSIDSVHPSIFSTDARQMGVTLLEMDEREFTQTADGLQKRKLGCANSQEPPRIVDHDDWANHDANWGPLRPTPVQNAITHAPPLSSPPTKPNIFKYTKRETSHTWQRMDKITEWDQSPENIELDELDVLFATYGCGKRAP